MIPPTNVNLTQRWLRRRKWATETPTTRDSDRSATMPPLPPRSFPLLPNASPSRGRKRLRLLSTGDLSTVPWLSRIPSSPSRCHHLRDSIAFRLCAAIRMSGPSAARGGGEPKFTVVPIPDPAKDFESVTRVVVNRRAFRGIRLLRLVASVAPGCVHAHAYATTPSITCP